MGKVTWKEKKKPLGRCDAKKWEREREGEGEKDHKVEKKQQDKDIRKEEKKTGCKWDEGKREQRGGN